ncbi:MAG: VOC family protein [Acidobacteriota bacterium]
MRVLGTSSLSAFVVTANPDEARKFYENILGLTFVSEDQYALVFDSQGTTLRIQKIPEVDPRAFTVLGWHVEDIAAAVAALVAKGVQFELYDYMHPDELGIVTFEGGAKVAWFKDPDGNLLSLDQY